jgi:hypothetical protein
MSSSDLFGRHGGRWNHSFAAIRRWAETVTTLYRDGGLFRTDRTDKLGYKVAMRRNLGMGKKLDFGWSPPICLFAAITLSLGLFVQPICLI